MIIVKIFGGLGNQLFQYSFGKYLAKIVNTNVCFEIQTVNNTRNFTSRELDLLFFNVQLDLASNEEIRKLKSFSGRGLERIGRKIAQNLPGLYSSYFVEPAFGYGSFSNHFKDNCYFDGYWQSYKYLETNERILRKEISPNNPHFDRNNDVLDAIMNSLSISIHIRRGDYLSNTKNSKLYSVCDLKYYKNATEHFTKTYPNPVFYVFSDDIDWAKTNFTGGQFIFISGNRPSEDMYLMSRCRHNIIANSTFSWWAAWLNQNRGKIVIAPINWYRGKLNEYSRNLVPENWIRI